MHVLKFRSVGKIARKSSLFEEIKFAAKDFHFVKFWGKIEVLSTRNFFLSEISNCLSANWNFLSRLLFLLTTPLLASV